MDVETPKYYSDRNILEVSGGGGGKGAGLGGEGGGGRGGFSKFFDVVCPGPKVQGSGLMKSILKSADRSKRDSIWSLESSRISGSSVGGGSEKKVRFLRQARESRNKNKKSLSLFDNYMCGIDKSVKKIHGVFLKSGQ